MRKERTAVLMSSVYMGLGQALLGQYAKAIAFAAVQTAFIWNIPYLAESLEGLATLGDIPQRISDGVAVGDHSVFLMVKGIMSVILILAGVLLYGINIADIRRSCGYRQPDRRTVFKSARDRAFVIVLLAPVGLLVLFLIVLPLLFTVSIAFTNYSGPNHLPPKHLVDWVGWRNFLDVFTQAFWGKTFAGVAVWTLVWTILSTVSTFFGGLILALLVNAKEVRGKRFWRGVLILPWTIPAFVSLLLMRMLFNGLGPINDALMGLGLERVAWLTDPLLAKATVLAVNLWLGAPYFMAMMSGVLTSINPDIYEASSMDGASAGRSFRSITLPLVLRLTAPLLIMNFAFNMNNFNVIFLLTDGNPVNPDYRYAGSTDIVISWIFKLTLDRQQFQMAAVISILLFAAIALLSLYQLSRTRAFREEGGLQ